VRQEELFEGWLSAQQLVDTRRGENPEQRLDRTLNLTTDDVTVDLYRVEAGHPGEIRH
jgi:hypothetical protein